MKGFRQLPQNDPASQFQNNSKYKFKDAFPLFKIHSDERDYLEII